MFLKNKLTDMGKTSTEISTHRDRGYAAAVGSALFLSMTAIFILHLTLDYELPALVLAYWREVMVAATLAAVFAIVKPERLHGVRGHTGYLVGYGLVLALFNALWTLSVALNGAAVATVLVYSSAGFTALLVWLILKEDLTLVKILVVVLSLLGCALVVNAFNPSVWGLNTTGVITGISAGLFYAVYSIMGRSASQRGLNTWTTLFYIFTFASIFMLGFNLLSGGKISGSAARPADMLWLGNAWAGWLMLAALAVGPTLMGYGLYNVSLRYLPSSTANLVVMIEPVFTAVFAYILFGEMLTAAQLVGGAMILGAVAVLRLGKT
jgi:drug/metabolite transporter (DMT)-like permease